MASADLPALSSPDESNGDCCCHGARKSMETFEMKRNRMNKQIASLCKLTALGATLALAAGCK
jgi:hypothetical protein